MVVKNAVPSITQIRGAIPQGRILCPISFHIYVNIPFEHRLNNKVQIDAYVTYISTKSFKPKVRVL
jgi:hypothetical protein